MIEKDADRLLGKKLLEYFTYHSEKGYLPYKTKRRYGYWIVKNTPSGDIKCRIYAYLENPLILRLVVRPSDPEKWQEYEYTFAPTQVVEKIDEVICDLISNKLQHYTWSKEARVIHDEYCCMKNKLKEAYRQLKANKPEMFRSPRTLV